MRGGIDRGVPQSGGRISLIDPLEDDVPYDADPDALTEDGEKRVIDA